MAANMCSFWRHPEARVVACVLAVLGVNELAMRAAGHRLSKDIQHLEQFDSIAARATAPGLDGETRIVCLGNSLTRFGVDPDEFRQAALNRGLGPIRLEKLMPDNTALADWYYAYRTYFTARRRAPDVLVIGFQGGHLRDAPSQHPERLARYYCRWADLPELCRRDLPTFEDRAGFGAAGASALLCNRDRIESRVLDWLIPGYRENIQELNRRVNSALTTASAPLPTFGRLEELLDQARADGVQVVLAAIPVPQPYEIDADLPRIAAAHGALLVDCRRVPGITTDMFPDGLHMNAAAAKLFTRYLVEQLNPQQLLAGRHDD